MTGPSPSQNEKRDVQAVRKADADDVAAFVGELQATLSSVKEGECSARAEISPEDPELAAVVATLNELLASLEHTFATVDGFAGDVGETSRETTRGVEDVRSETESAHGPAQEISDTTEKQERKVAELSNEMGNVSATIEEITATATAVAEQSERTATRGEEGQQMAQRAIEQLDGLESNI